MRKLALILGFGQSGQAAFHLAQSLGYQVVIADKNYKSISHDYLCVSDQALLDPHDFDLVIVSPGISPKNFLYKRCQNHPRFMGEAEFALLHLKSKAIAITGSNGKTTLASFITFALNHAKIPAIAAGNIGYPLSQAVLQHQENTWFVCELSSFQLETMKHKHFDLGVILNITPDHLDRYETFQDYRQAKLNLISNINKNGKVVLPQNELIHLKDLRDTINYQTINPIDDENLKSFQNELRNLGHFYDLETLFCMKSVLNFFHLSEEFFYACLKKFSKPRHRLEFVKSFNGVDFYNDSKSTNIESLSFALQSFSKPIHLILGGQDKGLDFSHLRLGLLKYVKNVYALGEMKEKIAASLNKHVNVVKVEGLDQAVQLAYCEAKRGDVILLSPGCSSLDQFDHFQQRGDMFVKHVLELK